jgi:putative ABC transport system permease protein
LPSGNGNPVPGIRAGTWQLAPGTRSMNDIRFAIRSLARAPGLTLVAILTLALGIGANSAVFSLVDAVLIRPLPFVQPDRLVVLYEMREGYGRANVSAHEFVAWREQNRSFDGLSMYNYRGLTLTGTGEPVQLKAQTVTADFFEVLGERPIVGRTFRRGEDEAGSAPVVLLSRSVWQTRFGGDSAIVGRRIILDDKPHQVVGVMDSRGDMSSDLWMPLDLPGEAIKVGAHSNFVIGRLKNGVSLATARADLGTVAARLAATMPDANRGHGVHAVGLFEEMVGDVRRPIAIAFGATAFVLLIACANVGNLLLTRAAARQKELAIRVALGSGRSRLVRQLLTESLLLSVAGGVLGLLVAVWVADLLPNLSQVRVPRLAEIGVDWRVVAMTGAFCLAAGVVCGLIPALRASSPRMSIWLMEGNRGASGPGKRIAASLVVSQIALALTLLVGAGLSIRSFANLLAINPGFDSRGVLTVSIPLAGPRYPTAEAQRRTMTEINERLARLPGVTAAGGSTLLPLGPCCNGMPVRVEGKPEPAPGQDIGARSTVVSGRYFEAMRIPLIQGRVFAASDARIAIPLIRWWPEQPNPDRFNEPQPAPVAVINETMARQFWPNEPVIGKRFRVLFSPLVTVIGVVGDVRQSGLLEAPIPQMYLSDLQEPSGALTMVLRTPGDPHSLATGIRDQVHAVDRALPLGAMQTMDEVVWNSIGRPRFNALLLGASGVIALLLAVLGVYAVVSYAVERRTHEIGIRRALGAQTSDVLSMVFRQAFAMVTAGLVLGVIGALALTRVLGTLLYDVRPNDPLTFLAVAALLASVALLASYLPGRRATLVDPTEALRSE